jgi:hypothetical protein
VCQTSEPQACAEGFHTLSKVRIGYLGKGLQLLALEEMKSENEKGYLCRPERTRNVRFGFHEILEGQNFTRRSNCDLDKT